MFFKTKKFINPYIEKVESHNKIINNEEDAFFKKGKWSSFFENENPIVLEIGTGLGNFFSTEVANNPLNNYIGLEIKFKRIYVGAEKTLKKGGKNFVFVKTNGKNIKKLFENEEINKTYIFFPDPWDKKDYQRKNRLIDEKFLLDLYNITKKGGILIFKTDHLEYFETVIGIVEKINFWKIQRKSFDYENEIPEFDKNNLTEFEGIFRGHKLKINYLELKK